LKSNFDCTVYKKIDVLFNYIVENTFKIERSISKTTHLKYMRIGGGEGGSSPSLGSRKRLLVSDFWKIDKKFS